MAKSLPKRSQVKEADKWKIEDLFASDNIWKEEYETVRELVKKLSGYRGRLGQSSQVLKEFLELYETISNRMERIYVYAHQKYHEDTGNGIYQGLADMASRLGVFVESAGAFAVPEILSIPKETLSSFLKDQSLRSFGRYLEEIIRKKPHTLDAQMEELLADAGEMAEAPSNIFSMFDNADIKFPIITDEKGNQVEITHGRYMKFLQSNDRRVRKDAFMGLYETYHKFRNTLAAAFSANIKKEIFYARARRYGSTLENALDGGNIPVDVYFNLLEAVHDSLPLMYRYVALRKKALKLPELHMYDLYTPMVTDVDMGVPFEEAKAIVAQALKPLGKEYGEVLQTGFSNGWIDVYENEGKRSGAYSWGAYGTHPYVMLNFQETLQETFTLAHEMGHAIHSWYSDKNQSFFNAGYQIFVAEVASTVNEALLMQDLLKKTEDKKKKAYLLNYHLEQFRTTLFRQAMFAEFEQKVHHMAEEGETLTADTLCRIYSQLNQLYFGNDIVVDPEIAMEWARIPHFYTPFYVYQYATGYSAAIALSKKILEEGPKAVEPYIHEFLSGGCSRDPIDLLKAAGVDMTTKKPVEEALKVFGALLDELEALLLD